MSECVCMCVSICVSMYVCASNAFVLLEYSG